MTPLTRLHLKNFQNHERVDIQLDPFITSICGATDAGKSTILKALQWVCRNVPSGQDFISHGKTMAEVGLQAEQSTIRRSRKTNGRGSFRLDLQTYKAFGSKVPDEIAKLLNVTELNFQNQDDPRFWLSLSPGELSKELNKLTQLDVVDRSLAYLGQHARRLAAERSVTHERLAQAKATASHLAPAVAMDREWTAVEVLESCLETRREKRAVLARLAELATDAARTARNAGKAQLWAGKLAGIGAKHRGVAARRKRLVALIHSADQSRIYARRPFPDIDALIEQRTQADVFAERNRLIRMLVDDITTTRRVLCQVTSDLEIAEQHLNRLAPNQKATCPKCGAKFSLSSSAIVTSRTACRHAGTIKAGTTSKRITATNSTR